MPGCPRCRGGDPFNRQQTVMDTGYQISDDNRLG